MNCSRGGLEISACSFVATPLRAMAMAWLILCAGTLHAATITVINNNDSGAGSLRAAVASASPGDTIVFASIPSPITLTSGAIVISQNLTINGPGAGTLTVSAGKASSVFSVASGTVTISKLTISDGFSLVAGGGIFNAGTLTLADATVSGNAANICCGGGIYNNLGTMTLNNVTVSGNHTAGTGGGIGNDGTMTITNSTVSGGSAGGGGGGIFNAGTMIITNTAVSGNNATGVGGGIGTSGTLTLSNSTLSGNSGTFGGGIGAEAATTITNSTISGNMAATEGAAIDVLGGTTTLTNVTIAANGSGGEAQLNIGNTNGAATTIESTIIGNPLAGWNNCSGVVPTSAGFNLDSANSCAFGMPTDLINTNPLLRPLANNGGPTLTLALLPGSPAINKGANPLALAFDQRGPGFARVSGGGTDIGAFEVQVAPGAPASVPTLGGVALLALAALSALFAVAPLHRRRVRR
jgi:hypothetical protein